MILPTKNLYSDPYNPSGTSPPRQPNPSNRGTSPPLQRVFSTDGTQVIPEQMESKDNSPVSLGEILPKVTHLARAISGFIKDKLPTLLAVFTTMIGIALGIKTVIKPKPA